MWTYLLLFSTRAFIEKIRKTAESFCISSTYLEIKYLTILFLVIGSVHCSHELFLKYDVLERTDIQHHAWHRRQPLHSTTSRRDVRQEPAQSRDQAAQEQDVRRVRVQRLQEDRVRSRRALRCLRGALDRQVLAHAVR